MLIYVNQFELMEPNSFETACRSICGWLKSVTKKHFTTEDLLSGEDFSIDRMMVRTYLATELAPKLYSILFTHPDHTVKGRHWITEIGVRCEGETTTVSILLEISDISTLVTELPSTTRPKLVSYLLENANFNPKTIGMRVQYIEDDPSSFKALGYEIDRKERAYPLVLVSNVKSNNKPLINPIMLQKQLVGLAQVISSKDEINSWELEDELTKQYSAWDGAINIIYPSYGRPNCQRRLLLKDTITELMDSGVHINQHILSYITHTTNGHNKKKHFSPTDVRAKRQKDYRIQLKKRFQELNNDSEYQSLAEEAYEQLEEQENVIALLKEKHDAEIDELTATILDTDDQLDQAKADQRVLRIRIDAIQGSSSKEGQSIITFGEESEKFNGEIIDLVLEALTAYSENFKKQSRSSHILNDILECNPLIGTKANYIDNLKQTFNNYNGMTPKIRSTLRTMGLEVVEDGNHNHLRFINEARYQVAFAKTPSDNRVGANVIRDIKAELL